MLGTIATYLKYFPTKGVVVRLGEKITNAGVF